MARADENRTASSGVVPPALPDKATWYTFRKSRHEFRPGLCDSCQHDVDKLYQRNESSFYYCPACWWQIEDGEQKRAA